MLGMGGGWEERLKTVTQNRRAAQQKNTWIW